MIKVCAWCRKEGLSETEEASLRLSDVPVSHGICRYHELRLRLQYRRTLLQSAFLVTGRARPTSLPDDPLCASPLKPSGLWGLLTSLILLIKHELI